MVKILPIPALEGQGGVWSADGISREKCKITMAANEGDKPAILGLKPYTDHKSSAYGLNITTSYRFLASKKIIKNMNLIPTTCMSSA